MPEPESTQSALYLSATEYKAINKTEQIAVSPAKIGLRLPSSLLIADTAAQTIHATNKIHVSVTSLSQNSDKRTHGLIHTMIKK